MSGLLVGRQQRGSTWSATVLARKISHGHWRDTASRRSSISPPSTHAKCGQLSFVLPDACADQLRTPTMSFNGSLRSWATFRTASPWSYQA